MRESADMSDPKDASATRTSQSQLLLDDERPGVARYLQAVRTHWRLVSAMLIVGVLTAGLYSFLASPRYEAKADLLVAPVSGFDPTFLGMNVLRETGDPTRPVLTLARLAATPQVEEAVQKKLGQQFPGLGGMVEVVPLGQSSILTIKASATSGPDAARIANAWADVVVEQRSAQFNAELTETLKRLRSQLDAIPADLRDSGDGVGLRERINELQSLQGGSDPTVSVASSAVVPLSPVWPRPVLSMAIAFVVCALVAVGVALALELLTPRLTREDELLLSHRLPILARVPRLTRREIRISVTSPSQLPPQAWESYRTLRASLTSGSPDSFPRTVLVTSAMPREGKTLTAVNFAISLANSGLRVILVDGDLRRPMVSAIFGAVARVRDLPPLALPPESIDDALVSVPRFPGLRLLPTNPDFAHLADLLNPAGLRERLDALSAQADIVVVDSPPITEVADGLILASSVDAVVIAVRLGYSRRDRLILLRRMLAQARVAPLGFVVTVRERPRGYEYYYGQTSANGSRPEPGRVPVPAQASTRRPAQAPSAPDPAASPVASD